MGRLPLQLQTMANTLRNARRRRGVSIAALAVEASVSPRLISEFEQGKRPNVSLETALRLLSLVGVSIRLHDATEPNDAAQARAERAARRRSSWTGSLALLESQAAPSAPSSASARLDAVAHTSALAVGLQRAARPPRR
jgi:transcriptional regulator with XRE-family HTH domain